MCWLRGKVSPPTPQLIFELPDGRSCLLIFTGVSVGVVSRGRWVRRDGFRLLLGLAVLDGIQPGAPDPAEHSQLKEIGQAIELGRLSRRQTAVVPACPM